MTTAKRSTAIVSSLFPEQVADRLMENAGKRRHSLFSSRSRQKVQRPIMMRNVSPRLTLEAQDSHENARDFEMSLKDPSDSTAKPIAELYPRATVFFGDIVGFTAWSSEREPSQVFELLEKIYSSFDRIAKRKRVFKVETIGDCYMAATGLPDTRSDHAIIMARFARDCLKKMLHVVRRLESRLGPSTGDLGMRIGIHSGPVTAGVLRGDKARFQLFGDTVNTAARMESTGCKNKIQVSAETAALIKEAQNPDIWVVPREEKVEAKGKGTMETFWLAYSNMGAGRSHESISSGDSLSIGNFTEASDRFGSVTEMLEDSHEDKIDRALDWTVDVLQRLLKKVVAMKGSLSTSRATSASRQELNSKRKQGTTPLDEVVEIIDLPSQERSFAIDPQDVELPPQVLLQLRDYVRKIYSMYNNNAFHNYEHATHVTMSVTKLLSRVVSPNSADLGLETDLHEYTYGITSDPLAQFAVALAALIHDVDHPGVPNVVLVNERTEDALMYKNLSVAEQKSVDLAWDLLEESRYMQLRSCIYGNKEEFLRFRQLVVNAVMATDIVDKELGAARKARWQKAFAKREDGDAENVVEDAIKDANRKATIVIEHLIQASDVAHTMQHWHIYIRWNERFFFECYKGYLDGRTEKDPSLDWYENEIGFFDYYIIPLARKLKDCQVFGVASDEYLNYAKANRQEWEVKGKDLVRGYLERFRDQAGTVKDESIM